jgi:hypothetical protein
MSIAQPKFNSRSNGVVVCGIIEETLVTLKPGLIIATGLRIS